MTWAPLYSDLATLGAYLRLPSADHTDDAVLTGALNDASRAIDQFCDRQFGLVAAPEVRYYTPKWWRRRNAYVVTIDDVMTQTGMVVAVDTSSNLTFSTTVDLTQARFTPYNAIPAGRPWEALQLPDSIQGSLNDGSVKITASWGWAAVPAVVADACVIQAARFVKGREAPFGIAGSPEMGTATMLGRWLHPEVQVMLRAYTRFWAGVS